MPWIAHAYVTNYQNLKQMFPPGNLHCCHGDILLHLDEAIRKEPGFVPNAVAVPYRRNAYAMFDLEKQDGHRVYYTFKDIVF